MLSNSIRLPAYFLKKAQFVLVITDFFQKCMPNFWFDNRTIGFFQIKFLLQIFFTAFFPRFTDKLISFPKSNNVLFKISFMFVI